MQTPEPKAETEGRARKNPNKNATKSRVPTRTRRPKRETFTVGFRVDTSDLARLERGAARAGISVHEYARVRLLELLDREEESHLVAEAHKTQLITERVGENLDLLRSDVALTLEILLLNLTPGDPQQIRRWIDENLRTKKVGHDQTEDGEG